MKTSLQEFLLNIPLHQLTFYTPLPKDVVYYENTCETIPEQWLEELTLIILNNRNDCEKLIGREIMMRLIQDPKLSGIIISNPGPIYMDEEIIKLCQGCQIPIIQINENISLLSHQRKSLIYPFNQLSIELNGFMEKGFTVIATEVSKAINSPLFYFDHNYQLIWQTGKNEALIELNRWLNTHRKEFEGILKATTINPSETWDSIKLPYQPYQPYVIHINDSIQQSILTSAQLNSWQKRLIDKLIGLTALYIQTENKFLEQQEVFKEHFVYDLLYHKFDSQKVMIKQGKRWGWNLEKPHHLFIIDIKITSDSLLNLNWLEDLLLNLEGHLSYLNETLIIFEFQEQIVVLLEDEEMRTSGARRNHVIQLATNIEQHLVEKWPSLQFNIGIGKWYQESLHLNKSYQEAKLALQFGKGWFENRKVFHINDLGISRLLLHINHELLVDFSDEYLSVLMDSDRESGSQYIKTLQVFIQYHGKVNEVADALFVHPNTLRNRIKKIEEMTGLSLQDPEELMNITMAIRILSFIQY